MVRIKPVKVYIKVRTVSEKDSTSLLFSNTFTVTVCREYVTKNAWQSPACSPPGVNAPAKLRDYWTKVQSSPNICHT